MDAADIEDIFTPAVDEVIDFCRLTDDFVDKELFQVYMATIWGNAVLDPAQCGITEADLPLLHDFLGEHIEDIVGEGMGIRECYEFIVSQDGEDALARLEVGQRHRDFLYYFARLILTPEEQGQGPIPD